MMSAGTSFAGYRIEGVLGRGGMGIVYEATQLALGRTVALKVMVHELSADEAFRERFRREGHAQAALDHRSVVPVFEAGAEGELLYIAMRLVRGPSLKELIRGEELDDERTLRLLAQIADALDTAHAAGLVHRDIKPPNILVGPGDHAYLADFGVTKVADQRTLTATDNLMGTLDYLAPEHIKGERVTERSDQYALAAVLYECLCGSVPYPKPTQAAVLFAHVADPPPSVSARRPELGAAIDRVLAQGLAKDPADRWDTASDLLDAAALALGYDPPGEREVARWRRRDSATPTEGRQAAPAAGAPAAPPPTAAPGTPGAPPAPRTPNAPLAAAPLPPVRDATTGAAPDYPTADHEAGFAETAAPQRGREPAIQYKPKPIPPDPASASRRRLALGLVAASLLGGAAGLVGSGLGDDDPQPPSIGTERQVGPLRFSTPASWTRVVNDLRLPGLTGAQAIRAPAPGGGTLLAASIRSTGPSLLPPEIEKALDGRPRQRGVKLGPDVEALESTFPAGQGQLVLYSVPTESAVATLGCAAPRDPAAARRFLDDCRRAAVTLRLDGASARPLGPDADYAKTLRDTLRDVQTRRRGLDGQLRATRRHPSRQSTLLQTAERDYRRGARTLAELRPGPRERTAHARIVAELTVIAAAYGDASAAARRVDRSDYRRAEQAAAQARTRLTAALRSLTPLGYRVA